jgi:hypothetical protein
MSLTGRTVAVSAMVIIDESRICSSSNDETITTLQLLRLRKLLPKVVKSIPYPRFSL